MRCSVGGYVQNLLVTGGCGFIGANFVRYILQAEPKVNIVNLDNHHQPSISLYGSLQWHLGPQSPPAHSHPVASGRG